MLASRNRTNVLICKTLYLKEEILGFQMLNAFIKFGKNGCHLKYQVKHQFLCEKHTNNK